jgi:[ribosomal protein S18]-alanine N-acetyltransferase
MSRIETRATLGESKDFSISRMTEHDLLEVVEIEEASGLSRWGWNAYHTELMQQGGVLMFVARCLDGEILSSGVRIKGFIASRLIADELHVNNVAVRSEYYRLGIGSALLETVLGESGRMGARLAFLEVRASNYPAQVLYTRCGFSITGRRRNYYSEPAEDALVMSRTLQGSA